MRLIIKKERLISFCFICLIGLAVLLAGRLIFYGSDSRNTAAEQEGQKDYIKWVDYNVPSEAMKKALDLDLSSQEEGVKLDWIQLLAYVTAQNGNNFAGYKDSQLEAVAEKLQGGAAIEELTKDMKYYDYYYEAYSAVLSGFVGAYEEEVPSEDGREMVWQKRYGLKAFSPIAKNFYYNHYDDFGQSRSYGFARNHLGNDLMGQVGTPIIAMEGGTVEAMGWNQYGGWRIGIRSMDKKRYYYYAHLRKNFPYKLGLKEGDEVSPGDVIGYMGRTGYSTKENTNNINTTHLHFGMQLIFDESQKECNSEIWIDVYQIVRFLDGHRSEVVKNLVTKDYRPAFRTRDIPKEKGGE
ncbi:M23 family metallopeptidase [Aminipila butyrica]|uniref:M23 family metallopeptidase n=2 Tax=Aminipila butyrica TaxID=433296 RepID=A0A858BXK1_9FIRM|nr:M23 family metallopeptidase [Aminipila butyrica]